MVCVMEQYPFTFQIAGHDIILLGPITARIVVKVNWDAGKAPTVSSEEKADVFRKTKALLKYMSAEGMIHSEQKISFEVAVKN